MAIIATRGKFKPASHSVRAVHRFPVGKHSAKPKEFHDLVVELAGDLPRLEMFSREVVPGWDTFGNEAPDSIEI